VYEVNQVGSKDFGSQNFTFLALKGKAVGAPKFYAQRRQRRVTDGIFYIAQIILVIHKSRKMKICDFFFSFFSTLNQYFPHIPYVASKN
jgi:hypothetical protein